MACCRATTGSTGASMVDGSAGGSTNSGFSSSGSGLSAASSSSSPEKWSRVSSKSAES